MVRGWFLAISGSEIWIFRKSGQTLFLRHFWQSFLKFPGNIPLHPNIIVEKIFWKLDFPDPASSFSENWENFGDFFKMFRRFLRIPHEINKMKILGLCYQPTKRLGSKPLVFYITSNFISDLRQVDRLCDLMVPQCWQLCFILQVILYQI